MKRTFALTLAIILCLGMVSSCGTAPQSSSASEVSEVASASSDTTSEPLKFSIGTASPGGAFYQGASALSTVINSKLDGYEAAVESVGASIASIELLRADEILMGMSSTDAAWEAYYGKDSFDGNAYPDLRCMIAGWPGVYMFVTTSDTGITDLQGFEGKLFSGAQKNSSTELLTQRVFEFFGIEPQLTNLAPADGARSLGDGTLSGFTVGYPAASVTELEASHDLNIILLNGEELASFTDAYPQYMELEIPAGYYKALPDGGSSVGQVNLFVTSKEADEEAIYQIVKAAYENVDLISTIFPEFAASLNADNIKNTTIPYHAGALRYFKEAGFDVPDELIPEEAK